MKLTPHETTLFAKSISSILDSSLIFPPVVKPSILYIFIDELLYFLFIDSIFSILFIPEIEKIIFLFNEWNFSITSTL